LIASGMITVVVVLAIAAASVLLLGPGTRRSTGPIAPAGDQRARIDLPGAVVDWYQDAMNVQQYWLLNHETQRYQLLNLPLAGAARDLRYAVVLGVESCGDNSEKRCKSYGRYDPATGQIEPWGIRSARYDFGEWSPDGDTVAFYRQTGEDGIWRLAEVLLVDVQTGERRSFPIHEEDGWLPNYLVGWTADSQGLILAGLGPGRYDLGADLLYRLDGSVAAIHRWATPGKTWQLKPVLGTNLIVRTPRPGAARPFEVRDAVTGAVVATYSYEQMLASGVVEPGPEFSTVLSAWISDHEVVGQRGFKEVLLADLRTGAVRKVAEIPGDGGGIHVAHVD